MTAFPPFPQESLYYFGERRTDKSTSTKYQGVETPSQVSCLFYEGILREVGVDWQLSLGFILDPFPLVIRQPDSVRALPGLCKHRARPGRPWSVLYRSVLAEFKSCFPSQSRKVWFLRFQTREDYCKSRASDFPLKRN